VPERNKLQLSRTQKLLSVLPPVILILANIFLFGPFTLYSGNLEEFHVPFASILKNFLTPSLIDVVILSLVGFFLPEKLYKRYVSILFIFGILIWLQQNIFVWNYGLIGKADIDLSNGAWRGWVDASAWIVCLLIALFFYRSTYKIARSASIALVVLECALLAFTSFSHPNIWTNGSDYTQSPANTFRFSSKQNVIHVILDEFQSDIFQKIIAEDSARYAKAFEGFTYFRSTSGSFPSTMMSMPAILTGQVYKNDVPAEQFVDTIYKGKTVPNVLFENGYDVDLASTIDWYRYGKFTNWYNIPVPYGVSPDEYERTNSDWMMNLILLRTSPFFLKSYLYNNQNGLPMLHFDNVQHFEALRHFANEDFLEDLINKMSVGREKPLYKFIHLTTTHWPTVVTADCQYAGKILPWEWNNITAQDRCSLNHFIEFLNKLKTLGIYDNALIVVQADHGCWRVPQSLNQISLKNAGKDIGEDFHDEEDFASKVCASSPLLLVKPPHSAGPLKISDAPTALTDIPATITSILNVNDKFEGRSLFDIRPDEVRERRFNYYYELLQSENKYYDFIDEYSITGNLFDRVSWKFIGRLIPPLTPPSVQTIDFGSDKAKRFMHSGWGTIEKEPGEGGRAFVWALGKTASIFISLPKTPDTLTANVKSLFKSGDQTVTVIVDGKEAGSWKNTEFSQWEKHSIVIPADQNRPTLSTVDFVFSEFIQSDNNEARQLALMFDSMTFAEQSK